jgi:hypothetical protein
MQLESGMRKGLATALVVCGVTAGLIFFADCLRPGQIRSVPLYPDPQERHSADEVSQLAGPIATVDGVDVESKGTAFELLPGCHVVTLRKRLSEGNMSGAWVADLGVITYAFRMKPGRLYSVDVATQLGSASRGTLTITAQERDQAGKVLALFESIRNNKDIEACRAWDEQMAEGPVDGGTVAEDPLAHVPGDGGAPRPKTRQITAFPGQ